MEDAWDEEAQILPKGADASAATRTTNARGTALRQSTQAPRLTRLASVGQPHPAHLVGSTRNPYTADRSPARYTLIRTLSHTPRLTHTHTLSHTL